MIVNCYNYKILDTHKFFNEIVDKHNEISILYSKAKLNFFVPVFCKFNLTTLF